MTRREEQRSGGFEVARAGWLRVGVLLALAVACAVAFSDRFRADVLRPGPVSGSHAVLEQECVRCHTAAESDAGSWMLSAFTGDAGYAGEADWRRCVLCHDRGADPLAPHGRPRGSLTSTGAPAGDDPDGGVLLELGAALAGRAWRDDPVACGVCHFEHQGRRADLTRIADHRCQMCHQRRFNGFASGHPELQEWPYQRRTRIRFDHDSHLRVHFADEAEHAPTMCIDCHELAADGSRVLTGGFEGTCAACHADQIAGVGRAGEKGIAFLGWPGLDLESLEEAGGVAASVVEAGWPEDADAAPTAFSRLLLTGEPGAAEWLPVVAGLDPYDLEGASVAELAAVGSWAAAMRRLLEDLGARGQEALRERLERGLGRALQREELAGLAAGLEPELCRLLVTEEGRRLSPGTARGGSERLPGGGWYRAGYDLHYRPTGHADRFLTAWCELAAREPAASEILAELRPAADEGRREPGICSKCHSLDRVADVVEIHWRALGARTRGETSSLTRFRHAPHFPVTDPSSGIGSKLAARNGCLTCHQLQAASRRPLDSYRQGDPLVFTGDFRPMDKGTCVRCHDETRPDTAPASCTNCHIYHATHMEVGEPTSPLPHRGR